MEDWPYLIFYILIIGVMIALIKISVGYFFIKNIDTYNLQYYTMNNRILNSISYKEGDRIYLGVVDIGNFNNKTLSETLLIGNIEKFRITAKLALKYFDKEENIEIFYDKQFYEDIQFSKYKYNSIKKRYYMLIKDENSLNNGILDLEIIFPKT